jgi:hypothetical protein
MIYTVLSATRIVGNPRQEEISMAYAAPAIADHQTRYLDASGTNEASSSAVSWAAVLAGSFVAAALSLTLLALGAGIGLSSLSPWSSSGASEAVVTKGGILYLIILEIIASAVGGYMAGRLRTKWVNVHTHEVYFRDTAHGFLTWAVGLVMTAAFLASASAAMTGATATNATSSSGAASALDPSYYFSDSLLRSNRVNPDRNDNLIRPEVELILANGIRQGYMPPADRSYLDGLVSERTGLAQPDADRRVTDVFNNARMAADYARRQVAHSLYWLFLALLIGAFCASYAATIGGRLRDHLPA